MFFNKISSFSRKYIFHHFETFLQSLSTLWLPQEVILYKTKLYITKKYQTNWDQNDCAILQKSQKLYAGCKPSTKFPPKALVSVNKRIKSNSNYALKFLQEENFIPIFYNYDRPRTVFFNSYKTIMLQHIKRYKLFNIICNFLRILFWMDSNLEILGVNNDSLSELIRNKKKLIIIVIK